MTEVTEFQNLRCYRKYTKIDKYIETIYAQYIEIIQFPVKNIFVTDEN